MEIAEFLISECLADIEQRGLFENPEDSTVHHVTPLWCAAVLSKLPIVRYLVHAGADINAVSDSGSTSVRSSCFMTNMVRETKFMPLNESPPFAKMISFVFFLFFRKLLSTWSKMGPISGNQTTTVTNSLIFVTFLFPFKENTRFIRDAYFEQVELV